MLGLPANTLPLVQYPLQQVLQIQPIEKLLFRGSHKSYRFAVGGGSHILLRALQIVYHLAQPVKEQQLCEIDNIHGHIFNLSPLCLI